MDSSPNSHSPSVEPFTTPKKHSTTGTPGAASVETSIHKESFQATPISASNTNYSTTHRNQQVAIPKLMGENVVQRYPAFFSSLLPELPDESDVSISCLKGLPGHLWNNSEFLFTTMENEPRMYDPLVATLNAILDFTPAQSSSSPSGLETSDPQAATTPSDPASTPIRSDYEFVRTDKNFANRDTLEDNAKDEPYMNRRTDLAMVSKTSRAENGSWYDVALSIEVKHELGTRAIQQAEGQAEAILKNAPTKRFLFSFLICGSLLEVCLWDRAGVITAEPIDVNSDPHRFIEIVRRFGSMSPVSLGFDETTTETPSGVKPPTQRGPIRSPIVAIQGETYYRIQTVSCSSSCFGRSTRCFKARKLVKIGKKRQWSQKTYLLKYFWNDVQRQPDEGEIYSKIKSAGIKQGIADCVGFVRLSKLSQIRNGLPLCRSNGDGDIEDTLKAEILGDRQLCVLVLATVGRSIAKAKTVHELISATIAAIKGHKEIYLEAGILHRDISTNNIRIQDPLEDFDDNDDVDDEAELTTEACGFLIDFDLSLIEDDSDKCHAERLARTGTFSFMAWQIMELPVDHSPKALTGLGDHGSQVVVSPPSIKTMARDIYMQQLNQMQESGSLPSPLHDFRHDLQSFFWVLLYICAGSPTFTQGILDKTHDSSDVMALFAQQDEQAARDGKKVFLEDGRRELWVAPDFEPLLPALFHLRILLYPKKSVWEVLAHDSFIAVLDKALQDPDIQERRPIKNHTFSPVYRRNAYKIFPPLKQSNSKKGSGSKSEKPAEPSAQSAPSSMRNRSILEGPMTRSRKSKQLGSVASSSNGPTRHQVSSSSSRKRAATTLLPGGEFKRAKKDRASSEGAH